MSDGATSETVAKVVRLEVPTVDTERAREDIEGGPLMARESGAIATTTKYVLLDESAPSVAEKARFTSVRMGLGRSSFTRVVTCGSLAPRRRDRGPSPCAQHAVWRSRTDFEAVLERT